MRDDGLRAVPDPGPLLLGDRMTGVPGSVVMPVLQGRRPLLVEVQALLGLHRAGAGTRPRALGFDPSRVALLLAVLGCRTEFMIGSGTEVFVAAVGGHHHHRAGGDLAVALGHCLGAHRPHHVPTTWSCSARWDWRASCGAWRGRIDAWLRRDRAGFNWAIVPESTPDEAIPAGACRRLAGPDADGGRLRGSDGRSAGYDACVVDRGSQPLNEALALIAPGTALREGLDRILQAKHGALIIVGTIRPSSRSAPVASCSTPSTAPSACPSWPKWTAPSSWPPTPRASPGPTCT